MVDAYIVNEGHILLIWHKKLQRWLPPGGVIDPNEIPDDAVVREVKEETGLDIVIYPSAESQGSDSAATPLHQPFRIQLIRIDGQAKYVALVYFCRATAFEVHINTDEAELARWLKREELDCYPLYPHVRFLCERALDFCP